VTTLNIGTTNATTINLGKSTTAVTLNCSTLNTVLPTTGTLSLGNVTSGTGAISLGNGTSQTSNIIIGNGNAAVTGSDKIVIGKSGKTNTISGTTTLDSGALTLNNATINVNTPLTVGYTTYPITTNTQIGYTISPGITWSQSGYTAIATSASLPIGNYLWTFSITLNGTFIPNFIYFCSNVYSTELDSYRVPFVDTGRPTLSGSYTFCNTVARTVSLVNYNPNAQTIVSGFWNIIRLS